MADFNDLRNAFAVFCEEKRKYWDDLNNKIKELYAGYSTHLGVDGKYYLTTTQNKCAYLQLGRFEGEEFKESQDFGDSENLEVDFCFRLTLDREENAFPKEYFIIPLSLKRRDGEYRVADKFKTSDKVTNFDVTTDKGAQELYSNITQEVIDSLATKIFN